MHSTPLVNDVQGTKELAHKLYCQCQSPSSAYRSIAKSVRTLRNKLEEADDVLSEVIARPEEVRVLHAADSSRKVLEGLEQLFQSSNQGTDLQDVGKASYHVETFSTWVDVTTKELSEALESLEQTTGHIGMIFDTSTPTRTQSSTVETPVSGTSSDPWAGATRHFISDGESVSDATSICSSVAASAAGPVLEMAMRQPTMMTTSSQLHNTLETSPSNPSDWRSPFASPDPMSIDIDTASLMILSDKPVSSPCYRITSMSQSGKRRAFTTYGDSRTPRGDTGSIPRRTDLITTKGGPTQDSKESELQQSLSKLVQTQRAEVAPMSTSSNEHALVQNCRSRHPWKPRELPAWSLPVVEQSTYEKAKSRGYQIEEHASQGPASHQNGITQRTAQTHVAIRASNMSTLSHYTTRVTLGRDHSDVYRGVRQSHTFHMPPRLESAPTRAARTINGVVDPSVMSSQNSSLGILDATIGLGAHTSVAELGTVTSKQRRDSDLEVDVDTERCKLITKNWNDGMWDEAKALIADPLKQASVSDSRTVNRRLQHLQGVIASLNGDWNIAIESFLLVLRTPIRDISSLDTGDCAAALWLGDTYALLGRRTEALLSYSIAAKGPLFRSTDSQLRQRLATEQTTCRNGKTASDLRTEIEKSMRHEQQVAVDSLLSTKFITKEVINTLLGDAIPRSTQPALNANHSRAIALCELGLKLESWEEMHRMQLNDSALKSSAPWPMIFDPFFSMACVASGRTDSPPCDLLQLIDSKRPPKIAKAAALSRKGMSSFTCQDLKWLITTLRECLKRLEIAWDEYSNGENTWLETQYDSVEGGVATKHFFTIMLFRLTFRSGYGAEVCSDGIYSARVRRSEPNFDKGVHQEEVKRIKKRIREYLDTALMRHEATSLQGVAMPMMSVNGGGLHRRVSLSSRGNTVFPRVGDSGSDSGSSPASRRPRSSFCA